jgi:hypothetical protein
MIVVPGILLKPGRTNRSQARKIISGKSKTSGFMALHRVTMFGSRNQSHEMNDSTKGGAHGRSGSSGLCDQPHPYPTTTSQRF